MIRERQLNTVTYAAGSTVQIELSKDAVYHALQIELDGNLSIAYPSSGASMKTYFQQGFPFNLISRLRVIRNGSDIVWAGSGKQLAAEHLMLNGRFPFARLWVDGTNNGGGTANALLTVSYRGLTIIPSNSEGIGCNVVPFNDAGGASGAQTNQVDFRGLVELWFQLGVDDKYYTTLVDARPLASYVVEIQWESLANILYGAGSSTAVITPTVNCQINSYDQDNMQLGIPFGTFKRSSMQPPGVGFSSSNSQALLPRGNLYYGVLIETLGLKSTGGFFGSTPTIADPGDDIISSIQNRINTNYYLRSVNWRDLQAKNRDDGQIPSSPWASLGAGKYGWAHLLYPCTGRSIKELVGTFSMDTFDLLLSTNSAAAPASAASGGASDGYVYLSGSTPTINLLTQEVIPGKSVAANAARGAFAGSISATSAKPGT